MSADIEVAVRNFLLTLDAVTALVPEASIRPDEFMQTDSPPGIYIEVIEENYENDISGTASLVDATIVVSAVSNDKGEAKAIADAIQTNDTEPGTGLAGCTVRTGVLPFQAMLVKKTYDRVPIKDGSNTSRRIWDSQYVLTFNQTV